MEAGCSLLKVMEADLSVTKLASLLKVIEAELF